MSTHALELLTSENSLGLWWWGGSDGK